LSLGSVTRCLPNRVSEHRLVDLLCGLQSHRLCSLQCKSYSHTKRYIYHLLFLTLRQVDSFFSLIPFSVHRLTISQGSLVTWTRNEAFHRLPFRNDKGLLICLAIEGLGLSRPDFPSHALVRFAVGSSQRFQHRMSCTLHI
jgi:hypothetical protein